MQKLFIDTNFICAVYNENDSLHKKAHKLQELLEQYTPVISNFILLETYTVLSQRISKQFAISFGERIRQKHEYALFWVDKRLEQEIWKIFISISNKNVSYVDASTLTIIKKEKITHLLSFDQSFNNLQKKFGFTLIPSM